MIEEGRSERAQQPIVCDFDLDPVEAGICRIAGAHREPFDHCAEIILVHCLRAEMAGRLGHLGRRPHQMRRVLERSMAGMRELAKDLSAMGVYSVRDLPQLRNDRRIPGVDEAA